MMPHSGKSTRSYAVIDRDLCVGVGECIRAAPHAFRYDKERLSIFKGKGEGYTLAELQEAADSCPMQAISVVEADGD